MKRRNKKTDVEAAGAAGADAGSSGDEGLILEAEQVGEGAAGGGVTGGDAAGGNGGGADDSTGHGAGGNASDGAGGNASDDGANVSGAAGNGAAAGESGANNGGGSAEVETESGSLPKDENAIALLAVKLAEAEKQSREYLDRWQRSAAEFENYKRRTQNEMDRLYTTSAADVIAAFLPVADSIERAVGAGGEGGEGSEGGESSKNGGDGGRSERGGADGGGAEGSKAESGGADGGGAESIEVLSNTADCNNAECGAGGPDPYKEGLVLIERQLSDVLRKLGVAPLPGVGEQFDPNLHEAVMHVKDEALGQNVICEEFQKGYMYKDRVVRHSIVKVAN